MSRVTHRWVLACAFATLTLGSTASVAAQRSQDERSSEQEELLIQRIESLLPLEAEARLEANRVAELREEERRRRSAQVVDTVVVGGLSAVIHLALLASFMRPAAGI